MPRVKERLSRLGLGRLQLVFICVGTSCRLAVGAALLIASASLPGAAVSVAPPAASAPQSRTDPAVKSRIVAGYGKLPLAFEPNQGQSAAEVKFLAHGPGYGLFLTSTEAVLTLHKPNKASPLTRGHASGKPPLSASARQSPSGEAEPPFTVRLKLLGANPHPTITGVDALPGKVNYLHGRDAKRWHTDIPTYRKVKFTQVYPGIDLVYYGNPRQLEHDFVVAPGAHPSAIALEISGAGQPSIDAQGDLVLVNPAGTLRFRKPIIYQEVNGQRQAVAGTYVLTAADRVGFRVGAHDATRPQVIDPVLVYSTYLGGSDYDAGLSIAVDSAGNAYVTGDTGSTDFPVTPGSFQSSSGGGQDAFVAKLNPAGAALVYSTYLGGSSDESGSGIALDGAGNAYITGRTSSTNFPLAGSPIQSSFGGYYDAFVAKIGVSFTDVSSTDWAYLDILAIQADGIALGCSLSPPLFCPSQAVTRAQMAAFLVRAKEGEPSTGCSSAPFNDVTLDNPYCKYIAALKALSITQVSGPT